MEIQLEKRELRKNIIKINQNQINQSQKQKQNLLHQIKKEIQDEKNNF